jgi:hypothetical protein
MGTRPGSVKSRPQRAPNGLFRPRISSDPGGEAPERGGRLVQDQGDRVGRQRQDLAQPEERPIRWAIVIGSRP